MINRKTMDLITVVFIILIIASFFLANQIFKNSFNNSSENPEESINAFMTSSLLAYLPFQILGLVYYIFILILAIQLHSRSKIGLVDTILIVVLIPFAFIFYLLTLRKQLKQYEIENK